MAVKIRLAPKGKRKQKVYAIQVADSRAPRDGRFIEKIGYYQTYTKPSTYVLNIQKAFEWIGKGAQPTNTVVSIFKAEGVSHKRHLDIGVFKGVLSQEDADLRFAKWFKKKEQKNFYRYFKEPDKVKMMRLDDYKSLLVSEGDDILRHIFGIKNPKEWYEELMEMDKSIPSWLDKNYTWGLPQHVYDKIKSVNENPYSYSVKTTIDGNDLVGRNLVLGNSYRVRLDLTLYDDTNRPEVLERQKLDCRSSENIRLKVIKDLFLDNKTKAGFAEIEVTPISKGEGY